MRNKRINNKKGIFSIEAFTLIELLVVVSIIGLLSTMAVVSLNVARQKARDAKRLSDIKQLSKLIENSITNGSNSDYLSVFNNGVCDVIGIGSASTTCLGVLEDNDLAKMIDPSAEPGDPTCNSLSVNACNYSITFASVTDYEICFYLENGAGDLDDGVHSMSSGSTIDASGATCSI